MYWLELIIGLLSLGVILSGVFAGAIILMAMDFIRIKPKDD